MKKFLINFIWVILLVYLIEFQPVTTSGSPTETVYHNYNDSASQSGGRPVVIVGDLQRTSIWEVMLGREQNDEQRTRIISEIKNENPAMMVLLGDMVNDGSRDDQWNYFDNLMLPVKEIPILPVLGNHDYDKSGRISHIRSRFPQFDQNQWYSRTYGNLAFIFLDSNEPKMTKAEWKEQKVWFENTLRMYENDPAVKSIMVFMHHPPYTNSLVTGDESHIQKSFVNSFVKSEKAAAMFSGHAHTYEHFIKEGKNFIVSGGGGGPRVMLKKGKACHKDEYTRKGMRPFHYILLQPHEDHVEVTVKGFDQLQDDLSIIDHFRLPFQILPEPQGIQSIQ